MTIKLANFPEALTERNQWIVWKTVSRDDKPTKVPFQVSDEFAKSNDSETWSPFADALARFECGGYAGLGYVFSPKDPYCGIDLDGCREPGSGKLQQWAREIILEFDTYAEVSPSMSGVKLFVIGALPFRGRKKDLADMPNVADKTPGVEVYDRGRYFAVTGHRLKGMPREPQERQALLNKLCERFWPEHRPSADFYSPDAAMDRARKYLAKVPPAVSGQSGHNATFHAACVLVCGFSLDRAQALQVLCEWNEACQPPWNQRELEHKVDDAFKVPGDRGYLRNANEYQWARVRVPDYKQPEPPKKLEETTLAAAAAKYLGRIQSGGTGLIETGLPDLDHAIGGGVEAGEMVVLAARPSHGKSLVGLQCAHNWTAAGMPVIFVTEEMSPIALGKRTLQYASAVPQEHWQSSTRTLGDDLEQYKAARSPCHIVSNCGTVERAVKEIETAVLDRAVRAAIVDYAQLLQSPGKGRYEQITKTSEALRRVANETKIVLLVLCQLNRQIEGRRKFVPMMSDIKETGQFEQDADVIVFLVWPHRIDQHQDPHEFVFYVSKNRNRPTHKSCVKCRIEPSRQMLLPREEEWT